MKKLLLGVFIIICTFMFSNTYAATIDDESFYTNGKIKMVNVISNDKSNDSIYEYKVSGVKENKASDFKEYTFELNGNSEYELDFSKVNYSETGIYRFIVEELSVNNKTEYTVDTNKYEVDVYVTNVNGKYIANVYKSVMNLEDNSKTDKFTFVHKRNTYMVVDLSNVGTKANPDEYFELVMNIDLKDGSKVTINGLDDEATYKGEKVTNPNEIIADGNEVKIYVKAGQRVTIGVTEGETLIYEIPVGTNVNIKENGAEKYQTKINNKVSRKIDLTLGISNNNLVEIINNADFDVAVTGLRKDIVPYIILITLSLSVLAFGYISRTRVMK